MSVPQRYAFGDFVLERAQRRVRRHDGTLLNLTPRLFDALLMFIENAGELLTKDALMLALWPGLVVEENNLSQIVSALRRALGDDTQGSRYIETVPRRGFRFVAAVDALPDNVTHSPMAAASAPADLPLAPSPQEPSAPAGTGASAAVIAVATADAVPADRSDTVQHETAPAEQLSQRRRWLHAAVAGSIALGLGAAGWWG